MTRGEIGKSSNFGCGDGVKTLACGFDSRRGNKLITTTEHLQSFNVVRTGRAEE